MKHISLFISLLISAQLSFLTAVPLDYHCSQECTPSRNEIQTKEQSDKPFSYIEISTNCCCACGCFIPLSGPFQKNVLPIIAQTKSVKTFKLPKVIFLMVNVEQTQIALSTPNKSIIPKAPQEVPLRI